MAGEGTGRYLRYALGEILLVVIGILIALQINNWNEERLERKLEREYLASMLNDLREDRQGIANAMPPSLIRNCSTAWMNCCSCWRSREMTRATSVICSSTRWCIPSGTSMWNFPG